MTKFSNNRTEDWIRDQVEEYKKRHKNYVLYANVLEQVLRRIAKKLAPMAIVQTRPKTISSFADKCQRKRTTYNDPVNQYTDLCGGRIIVSTAEQVKAISRYIEQHFLIDEENTINVSQRLKPAEFGYRSIHYIISFKAGIFPNKDNDTDIPHILLDDEKFPNRRAEVQVRTVLEHAWADISHEFFYKNPFKLPVKWERELAGAAAVLEGIDKTFSRIIDGLMYYSASYGAYLTEKQILEEIKLLEMVLSYDPNNVEVAAKIGELTVTLGEWEKTVKVLSQYKSSDNKSILKNLGFALCKMHEDEPDSDKFREGQHHLEQACDLTNEDVDALISLANTYKRIDDEKAEQLYRRAYELDSSNPYSLENYLNLEISSARDTSVISPMRPVINLAIKRSLEQAELRINLPWAFYIIGKFYLLLNKPYKSLEAYAKAVQISEAPWVIEAAMDSLAILRCVSQELSGYEWIKQFLLISKAVVAERKPGKISEKIDKTGLIKDNIGNYSSMHPETISSPIVIVVGGCDPSIEVQMKSYRILVMEAFKDYRGTVIGGGTKEGISGLVGELTEEYPGSIRTITYLPELIPADATVDRRYSEIRKTDGNGFTPLESIQAWIDIISAGIDTRRIKVLGINGGAISAIEYRIALALGAVVGVVEGSGREATRLLDDDDWVESGNLIRLPPDAMTIRAFIGSGVTKLEANIRERLAKEVHEEYRRSRQASVRIDEPSMADWDTLADYIKDSNAQQSDHIFEKLRQIGCTVKSVTDREIKLITFTDEEVELLAEMEHGRWNAERLLDGWVLGDKKDILKKVSPYLVSWSILPEEIRELDRLTVRKIPQFLAKVGLEICRQG